MNPEVDKFFSKIEKWNNELEKLRFIALECGLTEELKWGVPCYLHNKKNILLIHGFKQYCALNFFKGALLQDVDGILTQQTENVQAARQIRFTDIREINKTVAVIKAYIFEAIEIEKAGLQVNNSKNIALVYPEELQNKFNENPDLKKAFEALTPGRQRAYHLYFTEAKQNKTRENRIEKYLQRILNGKGMHDCNCGLSHNMPTCDGTHKYI
jgi:uncharacterized protein YdeI (YjbR/CyaY-like superfamily)